jgi:hypothetical protein
MTYPPFIESTTGINIEPLFRRRCFGEGVGHVGAIYEEISPGRNSIEHARACLVDLICVCLVVENM